MIYPVKPLALATILANAALAATHPTNYVIHEGRNTVVITFATLAEAQSFIRKLPLSHADCPTPRPDASGITVTVWYITDTDHLHFAGHMQPLPTGIKGAEEINRQYRQWTPPPWYINLFTPMKSKIRT